jgi:hypothetical protein
MANAIQVPVLKLAQIFAENSMTALFPKVLVETTDLKTRSTSG